MKKYKKLPGMRNIKRVSSISTSKNGNSAYIELFMLGERRNFLLNERKNMKQRDWEIEKELSELEKQMDVLEEKVKRLEAYSEGKMFNKEREKMERFVLEY